MNNYYIESWLDCKDNQMINCGRKIHRDIENPFDNYFIDMSIFLNKNIKKQTNIITPNILTFISFIFGLVSAYNIYISNFIIGLLFFNMSYLFDCMDGNMARMFNLSTRFGDYFDHISDIIKTIILIIAFVINPILNTTIKLLFILIYIVGLFLQAIHFGCQEIHSLYPNNSNSLCFTKNLCSNNTNIKYTKYFGCGTLTIIISLLFTFCWIFYGP